MTELELELDGEGRETRFCRRAWGDGERRGRREGFLIGTLFGVGIGFLAAVAVISRLM